MSMQGSAKNDYLEIFRSDFKSCEDLDWIDLGRLIEHSNLFINAEEVDVVKQKYLTLENQRKETIKELNIPFATAYSEEQSQIIHKKEKELFSSLISTIKKHYSKELFQYNDLHISVDDGYVKTTLGKYRHNLNTIYNIYGYRLNILFGIVKRYEKLHHLFFSYQDIRDINDYYNNFLNEVNYAPFEKMDIFRKSLELPKGKHEVNYFFIDVKSNLDLLFSILHSIKFNIKLMSILSYECINGLPKTSDKSRIEDFYKKIELIVKKYLESNCVEIIPHKNNISRINKTKLEKDTKVANQLIEEAEMNTIQAIDYWGDKTTFTTDFLNNWHIEVSDFRMNDKLAKAIIDQKFESLSKEELIKIVVNFKRFVEEPFQYRFCREMLKIKYPKHFENSLNEMFPSEKIIFILKEYSSIEQFKEQFDTSVSERKIEESGKRFREIVGSISDPEYLCWLFDVFGFCKTIGLPYISNNSIIEINSIMRKFNKNSDPLWTCFEPGSGGRWMQLKDAGCEYPGVDILSYFLQKDFKCDEGLVIEILKKSLECFNFADVIKEIKRLKRRFKNKRDNIIF